MEEKENVVIPTTTVEPTTDQPSSEQPKVEEQTNKGVSFDAQQQAKLNSLLKEEREKILRKLNVANFEEAQSKIAKANDYDNLVNENKVFKEKVEKVNELIGENALLKANVRDDMKEIVKGYFKGSGKELTYENLDEFFKTNPTLKSQWVGNAQPTIIGNPQSNENKQDNSYAEWKKLAGLDKKF